MCYRNVIAGHSTAFGVRFVQQSRSITLRLFTQHFLNNLHWSHLSPFVGRDALQQHKVRWCCWLFEVAVGDSCADGSGDGDDGGDGDGCVAGSADDHYHLQLQLQL